MTIKELIEKLQQLDPDLHVFTTGYEGGYHYAGVSGNITAANITANTGVFTGNGSGLSAIAGANVTGTVASATAATTAGTVTTAAQPNITSVGTLTSLAVTGNASAGNLNTAGAVVASTLTSNVATGTAPLTVTSTTQVANLNAATAGTADTVTTAAQPYNFFLVGLQILILSLANCRKSLSALMICTLLFL